MSTASEILGIERMWYVRIEKNPFREIGPCDETTAIEFMSHCASVGGVIVYLTDAEGGDPLYCAHAARGEPAEIVVKPPRPRHWGAKQ